MRAEEGSFRAPKDGHELAVPAEEGDRGATSSIEHVEIARSSGISIRGRWTVRTGVASIHGVVSGFSPRELAQRAGVEAGYIERLVELGILRTEDTAPSFSKGDVRRVRFVRALEQGGLPLEGMGAAVRSGDLSFAFFDSSTWDRFGGLTGKSFGELSAETGVGLEMLQLMREAMGFARPREEDPVREDEQDAVALLQLALAAGSDPAALERQLRVWGESLRRIAEGDANWFHTQVEVPLLMSGMSEAEVLDAGSQAAEAMTPLLDRALVAMYHAQSEHTWMGNVVEAVEATLETAGLYRKVAEPHAMCFLDLSGYTRLTEERGDEAAAQLAASLGRLVQRIANDYGGRPVKWLGDGVMIYFRQPGAAARAAIKMVEEAPAAGLPPAHVGIDAGPVVFQDGDYFGRTVNTAARIAAYARAGQVLVSEDVMQVSSDPGVEFVDIGSVELKGVSRLVRLHEARRHGPHR
jgi:adenylate cyclase